MQRLGLDVHDTPLPIGRSTTGLLGDKRQGRGLVEQAQLAVGRFGVGRIHEDAADQQVAMEVRDQRADVPGVFLFVLLPVDPLEAPHHLAIPIGPTRVIALVDAIIFADGRRLRGRVVQSELADGGVEGESVHAVAVAVHQHRTRTVDHVPGSHLPKAGLQEVFQSSITGRRDTPVNRENRTNRYVHIDVRRSIERVVQEYVLPCMAALGQRDRLIVLLGRHHTHTPASADRVLDSLVGQHVQLLLLFPLNVDSARTADDIQQPRAPNLSGNDLGG